MDVIRVWGWVPSVIVVEWWDKSRPTGVIARGLGVLVGCAFRRTDGP